MLGKITKRPKNWKLVIIIAVSMFIGFIIGAITINMPPKTESEYDWYRVTSTDTGSTNKIITIPSGYIISKEYSITIKEENVNTLVNNIIEQTKELGGNLIKTSYESIQYYEGAQIVVQIPSQKENEFLNYLKKHEIVSLRVIMFEVSEQYNDLKNKIELLQAKIEFYQDYINNTKLEPHDAEKYLERLFYLKSQLEYLKKQEKQSYITYHITIIQSKEPHTKKEVINYKEIVHNIKLIWAKILTITIYFLSIAVPTTVIIIIIRKIIKARHKH